MVLPAADLGRLAGVGQIRDRFLDHEIERIVALGPREGAILGLELRFLFLPVFQAFPVGACVSGLLLLELAPIGLERLVFLPGATGVDVHVGSRCDRSVLALLRHVVKEREELVEIPHRDRVILVIVTTGATHREPQPDRGGRLDAVGDILDEELGRNDAPLVVDPVIAPVGGGQASRIVGIGKKIAGDLLDAEFVEGKIAVVGIDDPVPPRPLGALEVVLVSGGVSVASGVEPDLGHAFAIGRRSEQAVDDLFIGIGALVGEEGGHLLRGWRQTGEVEGDTANEVLARRPLGRGQPGSLEPFPNEVIDGVLSFGNLGTDRSLEGPVLVVACSLRNPLAQQFLFLLRERPVRIRRRHHVDVVVSLDAIDEFAGLRVAGDDPGVVPETGGRVLEGVDPVVRFLVLGVRPMAVEALVREDGANVAIEVDVSPQSRIRRGQDHSEEKGCRKRESHGRANGGGTAKVRSLSYRVPFVCHGGPLGAFS